MKTTHQIQVGSVVVAKRASGVCDPGEVGVCYEVYPLTEGTGYRFRFESGRDDGFSPGDIQMFLDLTGRVCEAVADDPHHPTALTQSSGISDIGLLS